MTAGPRWFQRLSIRWRLMTVGLVGLTVALVAAGSLLYAVLSATLANTLGAEANSAARCHTEQGRLSDRCLGGAIVQVLDSSRSSPGRWSPIPHPLLAPTCGAPSQRYRKVLSGTHARLRRCRPARGAPVTVSPGAHRWQGCSAWSTLLFVGLPLLLLALAVVAWRSRCRPGPQRLPSADRRRRSIYRAVRRSTACRSPSL
jgi:hypothetical protein